MSFRDSIALIASLFFTQSASAQQGAPRVFYFCGSCDQAQMAATESELTQSAKKAGTSVIKMGNGSGDYLTWAEKHLESKNIGLVPFKEAYVIENEPQNAEEIKQVKEKWMNQIYDQLKKMDKTKPIVLHIGNHGENIHAGDPAMGTFRCFNYKKYTPVCITYQDLGDMMEKAELTQAKSPPVRVVGDHCFGGSAHYLSTRFSNVCSASVVSSKTSQSSIPSERASEGQLSFGSALWRAKNQSDAKDKTGVSLAEAFQSAWSSVPTPKEDIKSEPGGMLSSTFYMNSVLGEKNENKREDVRIDELYQFEKSLYRLNDKIFINQQVKSGAIYASDAGERRPDVCLSVPQPTDPKFLKTCESIIGKLGLNSGLNSFKESLDKMSDPAWVKEKKQNLERMKACWSNAQKAYDQASAEQKEYLEKSRWSAEFLWDVGDTIDHKKRDYSLVKEKAKMDLMDKTLNECVKANQAGAREYLVHLTNLKRIKKMEAFSNQASAKEKEIFRKKVECESVPLL